MKIFPKQYVLTIGSMSTKALIRQKGILVDKYNQPIEGRLKDLRKQKESIKNNPEEKEKIAEQIKELYEDSKTLINLTNKILVFLEPPDKEVWNILKSILSHDSLEIEFPFVNKNDRDGHFTYL
jgi:predicted oxidoreductase (fatty acid repression mutant protein)